MTLLLLAVLGAGLGLLAYVFVTVGYAALYGEAEKALERGDEAGAIRLLERLVRRYPAHAQAHHLLGLAHRRRGDAASARHHLELALRPPATGVPTAAARALLAEIYHETGETAAALVAIRRAAAEAPRDARILVRLCEYATVEGEHEVALDAVERALALPGADHTLRKVRGRLLSTLGRHAEAVLALREAVDGLPDDGEARLLLGEALEAAGDLAGAEVALREAVARPLGALAARAHLRLGTVIDRRGRVDDALSAYRAALAAAADGSAERKDILYRLGDLHMRRGETLDAVSFWEALYRIEPRYGDLVARLRVAPAVLADADIAATVLRLSPGEFRDLVVRILEKRGHQIESVRVRESEAVDATVRRHEDDRERRRIVHARRWSNDVGQLPLQELHLEVIEKEADGGLFLSVANISPAAFRFVQTIKVIEVVAGASFAQAVREAGFGAPAGRADRPPA